MFHKGSSKAQNWQTSCELFVQLWCFSTTLYIYQMLIIGERFGSFCTKWKQNLLRPFSRQLILYQFTNKKKISRSKEMTIKNCTIFWILEVKSLQNPFPKD